MPVDKKKIKAEIETVRLEVKNKTVGYIVTALGLVAGLAWNDAIKALIEHFIPQSENTVWAKLFYAILITLIVVLVSVYLVKLLNRDEEKKSEKKK